MMATIERAMGVFGRAMGVFGRAMGVFGRAMGVFGKWLRLQIDLLEKCQYIGIGILSDILFSHLFINPQII